jgi:hypothetical protein
MVVVQKDAVAELTTAGISLEGRVSAEILQAIFQKGSAVHDGAVLIEHDLVSRVGVILPLTQRAEVPDSYGTRHRAGMGLAERSDALVVVVSEERGEVTLLHGSHVVPMRSESHLVDALSALTTTAAYEVSRSLSALRPQDLRLPAMALALSAMVWGLAFLLPGASVRVRSVPLEFTHVPEGLTIASQSAETVEVWLRGSDFIFDSVSLEGLVARCDLATAHEGLNTVQISSDTFEVPLGLRVERIAIHQVSIRLANNAPSPQTPPLGPPK